MGLAADKAFIEEQPVGHALEAYAAYLDGGEENHRNRRLEYARRFASVYPDLSQWQQASLVEQLGSSQPALLRCSQYPVT